MKTQTLLGLTLVQSESVDNQTSSINNVSILFGLLLVLEGLGHNDAYYHDQGADFIMIAKHDDERRDMPYHDDQLISFGSYARDFK